MQKSFIAAKRQIEFTAGRVEAALYRDLPSAQFFRLTHENDEAQEVYICSLLL
jgi:hypothetical protein